ncbi:phosphatidylinositol kinase [Chryseotalea sanaruensis]|uniref:Phosphatidylinositol kinase n=1 Tax=Chryseotalea sanaruensis TaxID=2482724 RepID=A0A401UC60_9BACT|nr:HipA N-terminal domain-containing protein [Chryseotalea sanaruensis]GCC52486.1 phosphatidylinositol kinase [Chryseotalea sanaruensis]
MRKAKVFMHNELAGLLTENEEGYTFTYDTYYLAQQNSLPVSLTLPITSTPYHSKTLFAFFDGLIPEGWLLEIAERNWKLKSRDRMGLLLACCRDCIGAVSIIEEE